MPDTNQLPPLQVPKPPQHPGWKSLVLVFAAAFVIILIILNLPSIASAFAYPFTHSPEKDNEQLTQQYRDLYGYANHPELIQAVESSNVPRTSPTSYPIAAPQTAIMDISIPKLGIQAPVLQVPDASDNTIMATLKNGTVFYPGSALPGQPGTTVIVGHSSSTLPWTKYSAIFSTLDHLQANDIIYVTINGAQHAYRVRTIIKGSSQEIINSGLTGDLVLTTCWPVGTDRNRIAVSASLVQ